MEYPSKPAESLLVPILLSISVTAVVGGSADSAPIGVSLAGVRGVGDIADFTGLAGAAEEEAAAAAPTGFTVLGDATAAAGTLGGVEIFRTGSLGDSADAGVEAALSDDVAMVEAGGTTTGGTKSATGCSSKSGCSESAAVLN